MAQRDYAPLLPKQPPEGLIPWVLEKGLLSKELLIYTMDRYDDPLDGRKKQAVKLTCTACGKSVFTAKVENNGCHAGYCRGPYGFTHPETGETLTTGSMCLCPECGAQVGIAHVSGISALTGEECYPMTITTVGDKLALLGWCVQKRFQKNGECGITVRPYEAFVVEERCVIRLNAYNKFMSRVTMSGEWEQRKRYHDTWGKADLVYPWDRRILRGTTAENSKLDVYLRETKADNRYPVTYLRLWLAHPQAENLVVQGASNLLGELIGMTRNYYNSGPAVPKPEDVNWKERSPAKILGMNRDEYRMCVENKWNAATLRFWRKEKEKGRALTQEELALAAEFGFYNCRRLEEEQLDYLKVARYVRRQHGKDRRCDMRILWDYWRMAEEIGRDLSVREVRFPPSLMRTHDRADAELKRIRAEKLHVEQAQRAEKFTRRHEELSTLAWEREGILIRPVRDEEELKREGDALKHCVANYAGSHAEGTTAILLVRQAKRPEEPWYTLELDEKTMTVRQNRGKHNCARTKEVEEFEAAWVEHIRAMTGKTAKKKNSKEVNAA